MGRPLIDLTGRTFGRLTVLERIGVSLPARWRCACSCGSETASNGMGLKNGTTRSCGCLRDELARERMTKHGAHQTPEYEAWTQARYRCQNPKHRAYGNYGGRGIRVCARWRRSFNAFFMDMGARPSAQHSLERLNNDGPYSPTNCVWATRREQRRNSRQNRIIEFAGKRQPLMDWAHETGIHYETLRGRLNRWGDVGRALTQEVQR